MIFDSCLALVEEIARVCHGICRAPLGDKELAQEPTC